MTLLLSHQILDDVLRSRGIKSNDLAGIDALFGGVDGYYWYHTLKHMCPKGAVLQWSSPQALQAAVQGHENDTAAEDEVKPQVLREAHLAAMTTLLTVPG